MAEASNSAGANGGESDPTPVIERAGSGKLGIIVFAVVLAIGGIWIVSVMSTARQQAGQSPISAPSAASGRIEAGTAPDLPDRFGARGYPDRPNQEPVRPVRLARAPAPSMPAATTPVQRSAPQTSVQPEPAPSVATEYTPPRSFDQRPIPQAQRPELPDPATRLQDAAAESGERVRARRFANPAYTVPLGTIVPAVLETALDSTRSGSARAIVQQNVYGFDGTRILIPRGSRLYGEYEGDLQPGQNRALVTWTRLMRPDGVTVALESDASDQLGRAGIKGKVDSKFFQRFGGALLQSILDIGVGVATREASDGLIVALPGSTQNITRIDQQQITPTLRVKHGTSISVYVARDLDFADVGG